MTRIIAVVAALLLSTSSAFARAPAPSQHVRPGEVVVVQHAPAPARALAVAPPVHRAGYVWIAGHWKGRKWIPGHWELVRPAVGVSVAFGPAVVSVGGPL